jgi:hypothetical protein
LATRRSCRSILKIKFERKRSKEKLTTAALALPVGNSAWEIGLKMEKKRLVRFLKRERHEK